MSINKSARTIYEEGFRAFRRFSDMYASGSLSHTHATISEEILIILWHTVSNSFLPLKYSTIKTYLASISVYLYQGRFSGDH